MTRWFRMYADVIDDPKVQKLPPDVFKAWVNLLCLASRNDGVLPGLEDMAFALRMSQDVTRDMVVTLTSHGLLDDCDGLTPHNWAERQFKSDTPEGARERKRKQRAREKEASNPANVTECHSDSHGQVAPPEQSRTEQSRAEQTPAAAKGNGIADEVQGYLDRRADSLTQWEIDFLISIKWAETLSQSQMKTLAEIREKLAPRNALRVLPTVTRGTPAYDAWIAYYRRQSKTGKTFHETKDTLTVPTEFPPEVRAA